MVKVCYSALICFVISFLASPCVSWDPPKKGDLERTTLHKWGLYIWFQSWKFQESKCGGEGGVYEKPATVLHDSNVIKDRQVLPLQPQGSAVYLPSLGCNYSIVFAVLLAPC